MDPLLSPDTQEETNHCGLHRRVKKNGLGPSEISLTIPLSTPSNQGLNFPEITLDFSMTVLFIVLCLVTLECVLIGIFFRFIFGVIQ